MSKGEVLQQHMILMLMRLNLTKIVGVRAFWDPTLNNGIGGQHDVTYLT